MSRQACLALLVAAGLVLAGCGASPTSPASPARPTSGSSPSPSPGLAQTWAWRNLTPSVGPTPEARRNGSAVYDQVRRRLVVFGGTGDRGLLNDLWAFDLATSQWSRLEASGTPPEPRRGHDAVYDPVGHQMVVWAGQQGERFFNDTWTLDLQSLAWRDVSPAGRPQARYGSASVFDPAERRLVQFAGFTEEQRRFQDTQGFDLDTLSWEDVTPAGTKPDVRCLLTAALHRETRRMIVYGGQRSGALEDLWAFDLGTRIWTELTPAQSPAGRFFATSFVDARGRFIVFGGTTSAGDVNETWLFNVETGRWSLVEIPGPPSARDGMMGAYVADEDRLVVFGGTGGGLLNDVWQLTPGS